MARIVLGLQGTVDYEISWDPAVAEALAAEHRIAAGEPDPDVPIVDERSLLVALLGFLRAGTGGERFVRSSEIVEAFAARFGARVTLGGTSVRAALLLRALGTPSLLHLVSIDDTVRRLLPPECAYICSATEDTTDPHLIVQYRAGDRVRLAGGDVVAPEANRVIVANDPPAERLELSPLLERHAAGAEVLLLSGLNTIRDQGVLETRLREVRAVAARVPSSATVLYEDAGFHESAFAPRVADALASLVDVFSLNEDELQERVGRRVDLADPAEVLGAVRELHDRLARPTVVVHTRGWAVVYGDRAGEFVPAAEAGTIAAGARFALGDALSADDLADIATAPRQAGAVSFARAFTALAGARGRCVPAVDVRPSAPTTIGLGDTFVGGFIAALAGAFPVRERA